MKVKVQITEMLQRVIEIDAYDEETAIDIIEHDYLAEKIVLDAEDFKDVNFEVVK